MSDKQNDQSIRTQATEDDARLAERMKAIMTQTTSKPKKSGSNTPKTKPDWLKSGPKTKPTTEARPAASKPARRAKPGKAVPRPPKNSAESWQLAASKIAQSDN